MSPLTGERKRKYQRQWLAQRRAEYLAGRSCAFCGSTEKLEVDHLNAEHKIEHRIWSWSRQRLEAELAKCIVLCQRCHWERHAQGRPRHGAGGYKRGCRCEVCMAWNVQRRGRESNARKRLCRPSPSHSATSPDVPFVNADPTNEHGGDRGRATHYR